VPQRVVRVPKLLISGLVVGSLLLAQPAVAKAAAAYDRVKVSAAGISLLVPHAWLTVHTRDQAEQILGNHPEYSANGVTVDALLNTGFQSGHDSNGDDYDDRSVGLQVYRNAHSIGSLQDLRSRFGGVPFHDVTVKRSHVAQRPAFVATYVQDFGNTSISPVFVTTYVFVSRSHQIGLTFQTQQRSDDAFDKMTRTIVRSVRLTR